MNESRNLLIIACSKRKRIDPEPLPAIARYDGPTFRVVRRFLRQQRPEPPDIYVLSAQFGLIVRDCPIPYYDSRMTQQRARELQPKTIAKLERILECRPYQELCICAGRDYFKALDGYDRLIPSSLDVQIPTGSLGNKLVKLHTWLYGQPPELHPNYSTKASVGKARLKGVEVEMTPEQVFDVARQALLEGKGNPTAYQSWYVLVDEQQISTKWLVSQLTGLAVSQFHSSAARRMLTQLGIEVRCL